eukprot:scaffold211869_cov22-Tisochrysis_lutea.AAC.1
MQNAAKSPGHGAMAYRPPVNGTNPPAYTSDISHSLGLLPTDPCASAYPLLPLHNATHTNACAYCDLQRLVQGECEKQAGKAAKSLKPIQIFQKHDMPLQPI